MLETQGATSNYQNREAHLEPCGKAGNLFVAEKPTCMAGPRNWQPLALTAAHRLADSCCGFWCCSMSSVTLLSPSDLADLAALDLPSSSISWQLIRVTSFLCIGLRQWKKKCGKRSEGNEVVCNNEVFQNVNVQS